MRGHWGIENDLPGHLDVAFGEDAGRVREGHAPRNRSTLRKLALTLVQREPANDELEAQESSAR